MSTFSAMIPSSLSYERINSAFPSLSFGFHRVEAYPIASISCSNRMSIRSFFIWTGKYYFCLYREHIARLNFGLSDLDCMVIPDYTKRYQSHKIRSHAIRRTFERRRIRSWFIRTKGSMGYQPSYIRAYDQGNETGIEEVRVFHCENQQLWGRPYTMIERFLEISMVYHIRLEPQIGSLFSLISLHSNKSGSQESDKTFYRRWVKSKADSADPRVFRAHPGTFHFWRRVSIIGPNKF